MLEASIKYLAIVALSSGLGAWAWGSYLLSRYDCELFAPTSGAHGNPFKAEKPPR